MNIERDKNCMLLEVIAANLDDIKLISKTKADRIEFCKNLHTGGLTPDIEDIKKACNLTTIPINVMLRITDKSFIYTDTEFKNMLVDLEQIVKLPISGVVFGALKNDTEIDYEKIQKVVKIAKQYNKTVTFHKAFDKVANKEEQIIKLNEIGINTILTSGGEKITNNLDQLKKLKNSTNIKILAGGGVNFNNIKQIIHVVDEIHVGTSVRDNKSWDYPVNIDLINEMKNIIDNK